MFIPAPLLFAGKARISQPPRITILDVASQSLHAYCCMPSTAMFLEMSLCQTNARNQERLLALGFHTAYSNVAVH